jgi:hypothetical protein
MTGLLLHGVPGKALQGKDRHLNRWGRKGKEHSRPQEWPLRRPWGRSMWGTLWEQWAEQNSWCEVSEGRWWELRVGGAGQMEDHFRHTSFMQLWAEEWRGMALVLTCNSIVWIYFCEYSVWLLISEWMFYGWMNISRLSLCWSPPHSKCHIGQAKSGRWEWLFYNAPHSLGATVLCWLASSSTNPKK